MHEKRQNGALNSDVNSGFYLGCFAWGEKFQVAEVSTSFLEGFGDMTTRNMFDTRRSDEI